MKSFSEFINEGRNKPKYKPGKHYNIASDALTAKGFTLNAEDNYIYDFKITSDNPDALEYTNEEVHFYDDRRITITLMDDYWDTDYPW